MYDAHTNKFEDCYSNEIQHTTLGIIVALMSHKKFAGSKRSMYPIWPRGLQINTHTSAFSTSARLRFVHEGFYVVKDLFRLPFVWVAVSHHAAMIHEEFLEVPGQIRFSHRRPNDVISGVGQVGARAGASRS